VWTRHSPAGPEAVRYEAEMRVGVGDELILLEVYSILSDEKSKDVREEGDKEVVVVREKRAESTSIARVIFGSIGIYS